MKKPPFSPIRNIINKRICKGWWIQQFRKGMSPDTQRKCRLHHIPIKPVHPAQEITYFWWSVEIFLLHVNYENDGRRWKKQLGYVNREINYQPVRLRVSWNYPISEDSKKSTEKKNNWNLNSDDPFEKEFQISKRSMFRFRANLRRLIHPRRLTVRTRKIIGLNFQSFWLWTYFQGLLQLNFRSVLGCPLVLSNWVITPI